MTADWRTGPPLYYVVLDCPHGLDTGLKAVQDEAPRPLPWRAGRRHAQAALCVGRCDRS